MFTYMLLEFLGAGKQMAAKRILDNFQRLWDAKIMHVVYTLVYGDITNSTHICIFSISL